MIMGAHVYLDFYLSHYGMYKFRVPFPFLSCLLDTNLTLKRVKPVLVFRNRLIERVITTTVSTAFGNETTSTYS